MPRSSIQGRRNLQAGTVVEKIVPIPVGLTEFTLRLARNNWPELPGEPPDSEVIRGTVQISYDGGVTYTQGCGVGAIGGDHLDRNGVLRTETTLRSILAEPSNPNRVAKARFEVRATLNTKVDLDVD